MQHLEVEMAGEKVHLLAERALFWPAERALILSDLHLGKVSHFRRHGIHLPEAPSHINFQRLRHLLDHCQPRTVYFLGDLFHSHTNRELDALGALIGEHPVVEFHLIKGNHDILPAAHYTAIALETHPEPFFCGPFTFLHHPEEAPEAGFFLAGHLHPGVVLAGGGRQRLRLPCFFHAPHQLILPAFGEFTGLANMEPLPGDRVYVIAENEVIEVS